MKHIVRIFGVTALTAVIVFTMSVCDDGGNKAQTVTYSGKANGVTYTLLITEDASARAAYEPLPGDKYELKAGQNKSTGRVQAKSSGTLTLKPDKDGAAEFNATISGSSSLTGLSGCITWDSGTAFIAPGAMDGYGINLAVANTFDVYSDFTTKYTGNKDFTKVSSGGLQDNQFSEIAQNPSEWEAKITNGKLTLKLGTPKNEYITDGGFPQSEGLNITSGLKLFSFMAFKAEDESHIHWAEILNTFIIFLYSNKDGTLNGNATGDDGEGNPLKFVFNNVSVKTGWNTALVTNEGTNPNRSLTVSNITNIGSEYKWVIRLSN